MYQKDNMVTHIQASLKANWINSEVKLLFLQYHYWQFLEDIPDDSLNCDMNLTDNKADDRTKYTVFEDVGANQRLIQDIENIFVCTPQVQ